MRKLTAKIFVLKQMYNTCVLWKSALFEKYYPSWNYLFGLHNTTNSIICTKHTPCLVTILVGNNALIGTTALIYDINGRFIESVKITTNSQPVNLYRYVNRVHFIKLENKEAFKVIKQ